jgi:peptidoglycan/LPS O-acetylase OafA/YrhL
MLQSTFTPICLGVLLAHVLHRERGFTRIHAIFSSKWSLWIVAVGLAAAASTPGDLSGLPRLVIALLMACFIAGCVLDEQHVISRALARPLIRWIGVISYGMYIYHFFARHGAAWLLEKAHIESPLALFFSCTLFTLVIAALSFRWIEAPLSNWRRRLRHGSA